MCLPVADTSGVSASGVERQSWSESSANRALVGAVQQWSDHATNVIEPAPHGGSRDMAGVDLLEDDGDLEVGEDDVPLEVVDRDATAVGVLLDDLDRKSTRLNSSH